MGKGEKNGLFPVGLASIYPLHVSMFFGKNCLVVVCASIVTAGRNTSCKTVLLYLDHRATSGRFNSFLHRHLHVEPPNTRSECPPPAVASILSVTEDLLVMFSFRDLVCFVFVLAVLSFCLVFWLVFDC